MEQCTRLNNNESAAVELPAEQLAAELDLAWELSWFQWLFPVVGFSGQLIRLFVGNHTLQTALLFRADEVVGYSRLRAGADGELGQFVQQWDVRLERTNLTLIDNLEFTEASQQSEQRPERSFSEKLGASLSATKRNILDEIATTLNVIFGKPGRRPAKDGDSDSGDDNQAEEYRSQCSAEDERLLRARSMVVRHSRLVGIAPQPPGWQYSKEHSPRVDIGVVLTDSQFTVGPAEIRSLYQLKDFFKPFLYKDSQVFRAVAGAPLPESGVQLTMRFEGDTPRIKIPFLRPAAMGRRQRLGYFGIALGKLSLISVELPWVLVPEQPCAATYSLDLSNDAANPAQKLVLSSSAQQDLRWQRRFVVLSGDEQLRPPGVFLEATGGRIQYEQTYPLKWNQLYRKSWDIDLGQVYMCFLSEHRKMITELLADLSQGPFPDAKRFCPQHTSAAVRLRDYAIRMNANSDNVLHKMKDWGRTPAAATDVMLVVEGSLMEATVQLPRSSLIVRNETKSAYELKCIGGVHWSVQFPLTCAAARARHAQQGLVPLLQLGTFEIRMGATYHTQHQKGKMQFTDRLDVVVQMGQLKSVAQGDLICYLLHWWDNYMGSARHGLISYQDYIENNSRNVNAEGAVAALLHETQSEKFNPMDLYVIWQISGAEVTIPALMYDSDITDAIQYHGLASHSHITTDHDCIQLSFDDLSLEVFGPRGMQNDIYLLVSPISVKISTQASHPYRQGQQEKANIQLSALTYQSCRLFSDQKHGNTKFYHHNKVFLERIECDMSIEEVQVSVQAGVTFSNMLDPVFIRLRDVTQGDSQFMKMAKPPEKVLHYSVTEVDIQSINAVVAVRQKPARCWWYVLFSTPQLMYEAQSFNPGKSCSASSMLTVQSLTMRCIETDSVSSTEEPQYREIASCNVREPYGHHSEDVTPAFVMTTAFKLPREENQKHWQEQMTFLAEHNQNSQLDGLGGLGIHDLLESSRTMSPRGTAKKSRHSRQGSGLHSWQGSGLHSRQGSDASQANHSEETAGSLRQIRQARPSSKLNPKRGSSREHTPDTSKAPSTTPLQSVSDPGLRPLRSPHSASADTQAVAQSQGMEPSTVPVNAGPAHEAIIVRPTGENPEYACGASDDESDTFQSVNPYDTSEQTYMSFVPSDEEGDFIDYDSVPIQGFLPLGELDSGVHGSDQSPGALPNQQSWSPSNQHGANFTPRKGASPSAPRRHQRGLLGSPLATPRRVSASLGAVEDGLASESTTGTPLVVSDEVPNKLAEEMLEALKAASPSRSRSSDDAESPPLDETDTIRWTDTMPAFELLRRSALQGEATLFGCVDILEEPAEGLASSICRHWDTLEAVNICREQHAALKANIVPKVGVHQSHQSTEAETGSIGRQEICFEICNALQFHASPNLAQCVAVGVDVLQHPTPHSHHVEELADWYEQQLIIDSEATHVPVDFNSVAYSVKCSCSPVIAIQLINDVSSGKDLPIASLNEGHLYLTDISVASISMLGMAPTGLAGGLQATMSVTDVEMVTFGVNTDHAFDGKGNTSGANLVLSSVCIPAIEVRAAKQQSDISIRGLSDQFSDRAKRTTLIVEVSKSLCSFQECNWLALLLCAHEWSLPMRHLFRAVETWSSGQAGDRREVKSLESEMLQSGKESTSTRNQESHRYSDPADLDFLALRLVMRERARREADSPCLDFNPAQPVPTTYFSPMETFLTVHISGFELSIHESDVHSSAKLLSFQVNAVQIHKTYICHPRKQDRKKLYTEQARLLLAGRLTEAAAEGRRHREGIRRLGLCGQEAKSCDSLLLSIKDLSFEMTSSVWSQLVQAHSVLYRPDPSQPDIVHDGSPESAAHELVLQIGMVKVRLNGPTGHHLDFGMNNLMLKASDATGLEEVQRRQTCGVPTLWLFTQDPSMEFVDDQSGSRPVTIRATSFLVSATMQQALGKNHLDKVAILTVMQRFQFHVLSSFKPDVLEEFGRAFSIPGSHSIRSNWAESEKDSVTMAALLSIEIELILRLHDWASADDSKPAGLTIGVTVQPSGTEVMYTLDDFALNVSTSSCGAKQDRKKLYTEQARLLLAGRLTEAAAEGRRHSAAEAGQVGALRVFGTISAGSLTFRTPTAQEPLSIPLSAAECKFEGTKRDDGHFVASSFVAVEKMSSTFDAKLFPHLFYFFMTLQTMLASWLERGGNPDVFSPHFKAANAETNPTPVPLKQEARPLSGMLHITRIDIALRGIEVGARADHQLLVIKSQDFRLILRNVLGGRGVTPTADVDFGHVHLKLYGEHRIRSDLVPGKISNESQKVLHAQTCVEMVHQFEQSPVSPSTWRIKVALSDTRIIVHPTCQEHIVSFLTYFMSSFAQSRDDFDLDLEVLDTVVQPLMSEGVELFKEKSVQNLEKLKKNLRAGGWTVSLHFLMRDVSLCCAFSSRSHLLRGAPDSRELSALILLFPEAVMTSRITGLGNQHFKGLVHTDVKEWQSYFRSGVSMKTLASTLQQQQQQLSYANQIRFPGGRHEAIFESDMYDGTQKTTIWLNSLVSLKETTEIRINADIWEHVFELVKQYGDDSTEPLLPSSGREAFTGAVVGAESNTSDELSDSSELSDFQMPQHQLLIHTMLQAPSGQCKVYLKEQASSTSQFIETPEIAPLAVFMLPSFRCSMQSVNSMQPGVQGESWTDIILGQNNPVIQFDPKILLFFDQLMTVSEECSHSTPYRRNVSSRQNSDRPPRPPQLHGSLTPSPATGIWSRLRRRGSAGAATPSDRETEGSQPNSESKTEVGSTSGEVGSTSGTSHRRGRSADLTSNHEPKEGLDHSKTSSPASSFASFGQDTGFDAQNQNRSTDEVTQDNIGFAPGEQTDETTNKLEDCDNSAHDLHKYVRRLTFRMATTRVDFVEAEMDEYSETVSAVFHGISAAYVSHTYTSADDVNNSSWEFAPMLYISSDGFGVSVLEKEDIDPDQVNRVQISGVSATFGMMPAAKGLKEQIGVMVTVQDIGGLVDLDSIHCFSKVWHNWCSSASFTRAVSPTKKPRAADTPQPSTHFTPSLSEGLILTSLVVCNSKFTIKWPSKEEMSVVEISKGSFKDISGRHTWILVVQQARLEVYGQLINGTAKHGLLLSVGSMELSDSSDTNTLLVNAKVFEQSEFQQSEDACLIIHGLEGCNQRRLQLMVSRYQIEVRTCDNWDVNHESIQLLDVAGSSGQLTLVNNLVKHDKTDHDYDAILSVGRLYVATDPLLLERAQKFVEQVYKLMTQRLKFMSETGAYGVACGAFLEVFKKKRQPSRVFSDSHHDGASQPIKGPVVAKRIEITGELVTIKLMAAETSGYITKADWVQVEIGKTSINESEQPFLLSLTRYTKADGNVARHLKGHAAFALFNKNVLVFRMPDSVGCVNVRTMQRAGEPLTRVVINATEDFLVPEVKYNIEALEKLINVGIAKISDAYKRAIQEMPGEGAREDSPKSSQLWRQVRNSHMTSVRDFEVSAEISAQIGGLGTLDSLQSSELVKRVLPDLASYDRNYFATQIHFYVIDPLDGTMEHLGQPFKIAGKVYESTEAIQIVLS